MAKDNDEARADAKPATARPPWGKDNVTNVEKCRQPVKPGSYPKRRSDDEY